MNLMLISKYPPIQGGESAKAYWLAKGLGKKGHQVSIVSNCLEVEKEYRCNINENEIELLQPKNVRLYSSIPVSLPSFIPRTNPYSEKLTSMALDVAEERNPHLIFSWYSLGHKYFTRD